MTPFEPLPHAFPFRFADRTVEKTGPAAGRVRAAISGNAYAVAGGTLPASTLAELIAQAALLLEGGDPGLGRSGFLAGFQDLSIEREPQPGDVLTIDVSVAGRFGATVKLDGVVTDDAGRSVARGSIVVRQGRAT